MRWKIALVALGGLWMGQAGFAKADGMDPMPGMVGPRAVETKSVTLVGEVLDMDCYMNAGLHGKAHRSCAIRCLSEGSPVGLLTDRGEAYFLSSDKGTMKAHEYVRTLAGDRVEIKGVLHRRGGAICLDVDKVKRI